MKSTRKLAALVATLPAFAFTAVSCPVGDAPKGVISGVTDISFEVGDDSLPAPKTGQKLQAKASLNGSGDILYAWVLGSNTIPGQTGTTLEVLPEYYHSTISLLAYRESYIGAIVSKPTPKVNLDSGMPAIQDGDISLELSQPPTVGVELEAHLTDNAGNSRTDETGSFINTAVYIWWRSDNNDDDNHLVNIAGGKASTYVVGEEDLGSWITVWAVSPGFSSCVKSNLVGPVAGGSK